jgi:signal peptidase
MKFAVVILLILILTIYFVNFRAFTVVTASMEPTINSGSIIFVRKPLVYRTNDLITFKNTESGGTTTHRIVKIELSQGNYFVFTKGDANKYIDQTPTKTDDIIGKVILALPFAGTLLAALSSQKILSITFYIPAGIVLGTLLRKITQF